MSTRKGASRRGKRKSSEGVISAAGSWLAAMAGRFVFWLCLSIAAVAVVLGWQKIDSIPVGEISVQGYSGSSHSNRGVSLGEVMAIVAPYQSQPYWGLDLQRMRAELEAHPWIRQVTLFRSWPNNISVGVDEHLPIARWNDRHLLTSSGDLIEVASAALYSSLPSFVIAEQQFDSEKHILHMVDRYNQFQNLLNVQGQKIVELKLSEAGDIRLILAAGSIIELGKKDQNERLDKLVSLIERRLVGKWQDVATADLRYKQGVSIVWMDKEWEEEMESLAPLRSVQSMQVEEFDLADSAIKENMKIMNGSSFNG